MTATDTASYALTNKQAIQIAALHHVASKDDGRPILMAVRIKYSDSELRFTVTDSYRLVEREYEVVEAPASDVKDICKVVRMDDNGLAGEFIVNAVALRDTLKGAKSFQLVKFAIGDDTVTITVGDTVTTLSGITGTYPNTDRFWDENPSTDPMKVKYLAFSAQYIYEIARSTGRTPSQMGPVVLKGSSELKPIHVTMPGESSWKAMLMPVRT